MPLRLLVALLLLVAAPLALLGWVSATSVRQQREAAEQQLGRLLQSRLVELDDALTTIFDTHLRRLTEELSREGDVLGVLRELELSDPIARKGILLSRNGVLVYPPAPVARDSDGVAMHAALLTLVAGRTETNISDDLAGGGVKDSVTLQSPPPTSLGNADVADTSGGNRSPGQPSWQVWYMNEGLQLVLWVPRRDGLLAGVLLERVVWISEMTAMLPDSDLQRAPAPGPGPGGFTALVDESQQIVYRWGESGERDNEPLAKISLARPLPSWHLEYHAGAALIPPTSSIALLASLAGVAVLLLSLGAFVVTSVQRQMRRARSRVSFAGQVSHELRTPLTNIRLYAELAQSDLVDVNEEPPRKKLSERLAVIESESQRLSRLTSGVLEMIREDGPAPRPRLAPEVPDHVIEHSLQQFAPRFSELGLQVETDLHAEQVVAFDRDLLEMILVNLFSNVEKYAADGGRVEIRSRQSESVLHVSIRDYGPGIPRLKQRSVFRAFTRLDDSINAPSGTGIGLTIARTAARRHDGDLQLTSESPGTRFDLTILVKP